MKIERYAFGEITVEGQTYTMDVVICPGKVTSPWWRREGHRLGVSDLDAILRARPAVLVVGTGYFGRMKVPQETLSFLESRGIQVHVAETNDAVALFSRLQRECADIVAAPGSVKVIEFVLFGQPFIAMSAGPLDPFNHAVSFVVNCDDQG